jgi:cytosine/adenosine deaminase-related metal-dependent hydrolase
VLVAARSLLLDARTWIDGGGLWVERGVVRRVLRSWRAVQRLRSVRGARAEIEDVVLTPGLVDAHVHLDLGGARGTSPRGGFGPWLRRIVRARSELDRAELEAAVRAGARALLETGTTALGDIDASGTSTRLAPELPQRAVIYMEVLDAWDPQRTRAALRRLRVHARVRPGARVRHGASPHAPYTASAALLAGVERARAGRPIAVHWAETPEEGRWLERGDGPLARWLPSSPRRPGLELLDEAGLLTPLTTLVHGNCPRASELELVARRKVSVVHCPGTHAYFARPPFPFWRYLGRGIPLALGTDSLASNTALDMRREMALCRRAFARLSPQVVFALATEGGARALGLAGAGRLHAGAPADLVAWRLAARGHAAALEELTSGSPAVERVLVGGRCRFDRTHGARHAEKAVRGRSARDVPYTDARG